MNGNGRCHSLIYKELPQTEEGWRRLREFMVDAKGFIPPPRFGVAAIAETMDGEIVSAVILQAIPYAGPWYTKPEWRNRVDVTNMRRVLDSTFTNPGPGSLIIQGYVAMTAEESVAQLAEKAGLTRLEGCITLIRNIDKERPIPTLD